MRKVFVGAAVGLLLASVAAIVLFGPLFGKRSSEAAGAVIEVAATDPVPHTWSPSDMTVPVGTTVRWTMGNSTAPHTVTSDGCGNPAFGACTFDSGTVELLRAGSPRSSFEFTFANPGVYRYYCRLHATPGGVGQAGTVVVYAPGAAAPGKAPGRPELLQPAANTSVSIVSPKEGQTITGDKVEVNLSVQGATLRAPVTGLTEPAFGHYHLVLDTTVNLSLEFPRAVPGQGGGPGTGTGRGAGSVFHVSTNTFPLEGLNPGPHTLTVFWGFDNHFSPVKPISATVHFTTVAGISPPSTGDGGLADVARWRTLAPLSLVAPAMLVTLLMLLRLRKQR